MESLHLRRLALVASRATSHAVLLQPNAISVVVEARKLKRVEMEAVVVAVLGLVNTADQSAVGAHRAAGAVDPVMAGTTTTVLVKESYRVGSNVPIGLCPCAGTTPVVTIAFVDCLDHCAWH